MTTLPAPLMEIGVLVEEKFDEELNQVLNLKIDVSKDEFTVNSIEILSKFKFYFAQQF